MADVDSKPTGPAWCNSFVAPEGLYDKAFELTQPNQPGPLTTSTTSAPLVASQPNGVTNSDGAPPSIAPPLFPSKLATVTVRFSAAPPQPHGGGFLGGSKRQRETSAAAFGSPSMEMPSPLVGQAMQNLGAVGAPAPANASDTSPHHDDSSVHSSEEPGSSIHSTPMPNANAPLPSAPINVPGAPATVPSSPQAGRRRPTLGLATLSSLSASMSPGGHAGPAASRPKAAFKGTNSSFVKSYEGLPLAPVAIKALSTPDNAKDTAFTPSLPSGEIREFDRTFGIYTQNKMVVWCDMTPIYPPSSKPAPTGSPSRDPLAKMVFAASPSSVAINATTAGPTILDVLIGFNTGDIIYFDPFCARYTRFNKGGNVVASAVTSILWIPGAGAREGLFMSGHADGTTVVWDKEREDPTSFSTNAWPPGPMEVEDEEDEVQAQVDGREEVKSGLPPGGTSSMRARLLGKGKERRRPRDERADDIVVTQNWAPTDKKAKTNPMTHWRISRKAVKDMAFSPDLQHCAIVSEDGCLRVIDAATERLLDTYVGYFGALSCVTWSSDGRFVFTGGQDDLVTVYSPLEQRVVARCQGHSSFITSIAFDPWQTDERTSRFASVSEDCKIIFWDLSSAALSRPRVAPISNRRQSVGSTLSLSLSRRRTLESQTNLASPLGVDREAMFHPSPGRNEVAILQPVLIRQVSGDPLSSIQFERDSFVILSRSGQLKLFSRPIPASSPGGLSRHGNPSLVGIPFLATNDSSKAKKRGNKGGRRVKKDVGQGRRSTAGGDPGVLGLVKNLDNEGRIGEAL